MITILNSRELLLTEVEWHFTAQYESLGVSESFADM